MKTYQVVLKSRKHEIFSALDGEECLSTFNDHFNEKRDQDASKTDPHFGTTGSAPFDLVILDYRMPKKTGLEVAEQILSLAPQQRIIIASAYINELKLSSISRQSIELLQKPFELDVFLSLIEKVPVAWSRKSGQKPSTNNRASIGDVSAGTNFHDQFSKMSESLDLSELGIVLKLDL